MRHFAKPGYIFQHRIQEKRLIGMTDTEFQRWLKLHGISGDAARIAHLKRALERRQGRNCETTEEVV
jgi:hypothetical protein